MNMEFKDLRPAMPALLNAARIQPKDINEHVPPQDYIDGFMLPRGVCTLLSTDGGSGKTTSSISGAISSAVDGHFRFFGSRANSTPQRCLIVLGEETAGMISRKLAHEIPNGIKAYHHAEDSGNIAIVSWLEYSSSMTTPEKMFGESGGLTDIGRAFRDAILEWSPDFIVFDTLSSLSDGDYMSDRVAYTTMRELNHLASRTGAAVIMTSHIVKGSGSKIDEKSTASDLIALSRGSAAIVNAARHAIVLVPAPPGAYPGIERAPGDQVWMAGVKSNVGFSRAGQIFPVIRSSSLRTFVAFSVTASLIPRPTRLVCSLRMPRATSSTAATHPAC